MLGQPLDAPGPADLTVEQNQNRATITPVTRVNVYDVNAALIAQAYEVGSGSA